METWSEVQLQRAFNRYIRRLKDRKLFPEETERLQAEFEAVIQKAVDMRIRPDRLAFLPVFPRAIVSSPLAAATLMNDGMRRRNSMTGGYTFVLPELVMDTVEVPDDPYFLFDIDTGYRTLGMLPDELQRVFDEEGRRGLTDMEIVALGMHGDIFPFANLYAVASRYDRGRGIDLRMEGGHPILCHNDGDLDWQRWSIPSCSGEIVVCDHQASW